MYKRIKIESSEKIKIKTKLHEIYVLDERISLTKTKLHEIYVLDERISLTLTILSFDSERLRKLKAEQKAERE